MADAEPEDRSVTRIRGDRDLASNGRRTPAAAPVKVAAAVSATSTTKKVSEQANVKTQSEPDSAEVPSGRTRRRRSAVA